MLFPLFFLSNNSNLHSQTRTLNQQLSRVLW